MSRGQRNCRRAFSHRAYLSVQASYICTKSTKRDRKVIPFRSANHCRDPKYKHSSQRHHLLPLQLLGLKCFEPMFSNLGSDAIGFHDFRVNGLLLPSTERRSAETGLPLHGGPHKRYNEVVIMRVGSIEKDWSTSFSQDNEGANQVALSRIQWLQKALRRRLLVGTSQNSNCRPLVLNRHDPIGTGYDFTELDDMAETLFGTGAS